MQLIVRIVAVCAVLVPWTHANFIGVNPGSGSGGSSSGSGSVTDLSGTDLMNKYCKAANKRCTQGAEVEANFAGTEFQCQVRCNKRTDCISFYFTGDKVCIIRNARCALSNLQNADGDDFYRLKKGEVCEPERPQYVVPDNNFSNNFCMIWGKRCDGEGYYKKPQNINPMMPCLTKCTNMKTCSMVNYNAITQKCEPLINTPCPDEQLVDDPNSQNFIRLTKDEVECPSNRGPPSPNPPPPTTAPPPPPPTEAPTEEPTSPTEPPTEGPPPTSDTGMCTKAYERRKWGKKGKNVKAGCAKGCVMTVCNCGPWKRCDGAMFTPDGKCKVFVLRNKQGKAKRTRVAAQIRCEPASTIEYISYISSSEPNTPLLCGDEYDSAPNDCTFYARRRTSRRGLGKMSLSRKGRGKKRKGKTLKTCGANNNCGRIGRCKVTAACVTRK